jgi:hypothetical protein
MKRRLLIGLMCLCPLLAGAQTAKWVLKPQYSSITPYDENMLKVKLYGKVGLVNKEGKTVVDVSADSITPMHEDMGLVLKLADEGRYRILGLVDKTPRMIPILQEMYASEYPFFSEGKLVVANKKGSYGYLDVNGKLLLDFDYNQAAPFSEGWAVVSKSNFLKAGLKMVKLGGKRHKMFYVNDSGQTLTLPSELGDIYTATTFKEGEALVVTKDNRYCVIAPSGNVIRVEGDQELRFDYKNALLRTEDEEEELNDSYRPVYDGPEAFSNSKGLLGYRINGKMVLPPQFEKAYSFSGGCAIASTGNGRWGLLGLKDGSFICQYNEGTLTPTSSDEVAVDYTLSIPKEWEGQSLILYDMTDDPKKSYTGKIDDQKYTYALLLPKGDRNLAIGNDNLLIWSNESLGLNNVAPRKLKEDDISVSFSSSSLTANKDNKASFRVYVRNKSSETKTIQVSLSGDRVSSIEKTLTLAPNSRESISATFYNISKREVRSTTVKVSGMDNTISKAIVVNPFYIDF